MVRSGAGQLSAQQLAGLADLHPILGVSGFRTGLWLAGHRFNFTGYSVHRSQLDSRHGRHDLGRQTHQLTVYRKANFLGCYFAQCGFYIGNCIR